MKIITIGVKEYITLTHEVEIEVEDGCMKHVGDLMDCIEKSGAEDVESYTSAMSGIEVLDTFIEEVPDQDNIRYDTWIIDAREVN